MTQQQEIVGDKDDQMKPLHGLVMKIPVPSITQVGRHIHVNCPSGAVQAIPQILELRAVTKQQIDGEACSTDSAPESRHFTSKNLLKAWEARSESEFIDLEDGTGDARSRMICNRA